MDLLGKDLLEALVRCQDHFSQFFPKPLKTFGGSRGTSRVALVAPLEVPWVHPGGTVGSSRYYREPTVALRVLVAAGGPPLGVYRAVLPLKHAVVPDKKKCRPEHYTLREFLAATKVVSEHPVCRSQPSRMAIELQNLFYTTKKSKMFFSYLGHLSARTSLLVILLTLI